MASADSVVKLHLESGDYENKIKRATSGLKALEQQCRSAGANFTSANKEQVSFVQSLGKMETVSKSAKGRISELSNSYTELAVMYKRLTDEEKKSPFGQALNQSLTQLKTRVQEAKTELNSINKELNTNTSALSSGVGGFGNFNSVLGELGSKLGISSDLMGVVTTGTIGMTAAIGAGAVAVGAAAKAWADYNSELAKQDQITSVTTGLSGEEAQRLTDFARSISDTYGTDFRGNIDAVNTLMQQFGVTSEQAMNILSDGMQGMIQGDGQKLLQMIQQYAPAFRDAGVNASELVAVINNTEGGLFTDQNMQAITMGIKNIRLMKDTTKDALNSIGIDGDAMAQKLSDGTMTVFEALQEVSSKIGDVGEGSKEAGEVMQDVFGRQGTAAGTKLGEAIASLNTNLEETKLQTGEVGSATANLQKAQENLQRVLRQVFGTSAEGWEKMKIDLKTKVINAIKDVIKWFVDLYNKNITIRTNIATTIAVFETMWVAIKSNIKNCINAFKSLGDVLTSIVHSIELLIKGDFEGSWNALKGIGDIAVDFWNTFKENGRATAEDISGIISKALDSAINGRIDINFDDDGGSGGYGSTDYKGGSHGGSSSHGGSNSGRSGGRSGGSSGGRTHTTSKPTPTPKPTKTPTEKVEKIKTVTTTSLTALQLLEDELKTVQNSMKGWEGTEDWEQMNAYAEQLKAQIAAINGTPLKLVTTQSLSELQRLEEELATVQASMKGASNAEEYGEMEKYAAQVQKQIDGITGASAVTKWDNVASACSSFGSALQSLGDKGALGAVGLVASAVGQLIAQFAAIPKGATVWDWIAGSMAGVATLATVVSQIKSLSAGSYATGGKIPGNSYSGDNMVASVNSGEYVFNRAQMGNLASQLQGNYNAQASSPYVSGEQIFLGLNNYLRRSGRGEIITSR